MTKRDFVALLWEMQGKGILDTDESIYACLNPECASSLKSGLIANQFILMFVILGLAFLNVFSIGLAFHTMKFDIHAKATFTNVCIFISMMSIIAFGTTVMILKHFHSLEVNPVSIWPVV